jgi:hypothetical protein
VIICEFFVFNQTGANTVNGLYYQVSATTNGCGAIPSKDYPMSGVRLSTSQALMSFQSPGAKEALLVQEAQRMASPEHTPALDRAIVERLIQRIQER